MNEKLKQAILEKLQGKNKLQLLKAYNDTNKSDHPHKAEILEIILDYIKETHGIGLVAYIDLTFNPFKI